MPKTVTIACVLDLGGTDATVSCQRAGIQTEILNEGLTASILTSRFNPERQTLASCSKTNAAGWSGPLRKPLEQTLLFGGRNLDQLKW